MNNSILNQVIQWRQEGLTDEQIVDKLAGRYDVLKEAMDSLVDKYVPETERLSLYHELIHRSNR